MNLPCKNPIITHGFHEKRKRPNGTFRIHGGLDIISETGDLDLFAVNSGIVVDAGVSDTYGNRIRIKNYNGIYEVYGHLQDINPEIQKGYTIKEGQYLGIMGNTGISKNIHLHYGLSYGTTKTSEKIEPVELINKIKESKND